MKPTVGVLVMSYGTPESMDKVEEYYTHIRRGRPPEKEQLDELVERYEAIGGFFPLRKNTNAQIDALENYLKTNYNDVNFKCYNGLKHAHPLIEEGVQQMAKDGITQAVGVVLAPHYSIMSVGSYNKRAKEEAEAHGIQMSFVNDYHLHPEFIDAWSERVTETLNEFSDDVKNNVRIIFTAHSLPERVLEMNDPYPAQMLETSRAIIEQTGVKNEWQFAWQSAGQTPMPWLGPDILDVLRTINSEEAVQQVLICPIGFVSDHLEVLYDIDIECQDVAKELGIELRRTRQLNTDPLYIKTLADVVITSFEGNK